MVVAMQDIIHHASLVTLDFKNSANWRQPSEVTASKSIADSLSSILASLKANRDKAIGEDATRIAKRIAEIESILDLRNW